MTNTTVVNYFCPDCGWSICKCVKKEPEPVEDKCPVNKSKRIHWPVKSVMKEGTWYCSYCGKQGLPAPDRKPWEA